MKLFVPAAMIAAATALAILQGVVYAEGSPDDPVAESSLGTVPWELEGCRYAFARVPVPTDRMREMFPEGFRPGWVLYPGPAVEPPVSLFTIEFGTCASGSSLGGERGTTNFAIIYVPAVRTPHMPGIAAHYVAWDVMVDDPQLREWLVDAGVPATAGSGTIAFDEGGIPGARATFTMESLGEFRMNVVGTTAPAQPSSARLAIWHETDDGFALWRTQMEYASFQAPGTLDVPAGSWVAELLGATHVESRYFIGTQSYLDGTVELR